MKPRAFLKIAAAVLAALQLTAVPAVADTAAGGFAAGAADLHEKTNNLDEEPVLGGGEIRFLENKGSDAQQLSAVIRSSDGHVIVVDGGQEADTEHLFSVIREMGGYVDAWLVTHPQTDHVGGLCAMLRDHRADVDIRGIWYHFLESEWYASVDPAEYGMFQALTDQLATVDPARLHADAGRSTEVVLSDTLSFRVLNDPVRSYDMYAVNSSSLMYDINVNGKHLIILGDMSRSAGDRLMKQGVLENLTVDYVQMSHHGQDGVGEEFYRKLAPKNCIWPTTSWLYHIEPTNIRFKTVLTKNWVADLGVQNNYVTIGDDVLIR